jgi:dienelactone hydrolase
MRGPTCDGCGGLRPPLLGAPSGGLFFHAARQEKAAGSGSTPSTGSARRMMPELQCSGCARKYSSGKVAALGFCMGGRTAFLAAARGGVDASISLLRARHCQASRRATDDHNSIAAPLRPQRRAPEVDAVIAAAKGNRNVEVYLYPGAEHGFFTKGRPAFLGTITLVRNG